MCLIYIYSHNINSNVKLLNVAQKPFSIVKKYRISTFFSRPYSKFNLKFRLEVQ